MVLGVPSPEFPFKAYMQASERNQAESGFDKLGGLVPEAIQLAIQAKKQKQWQDVIGKMVADPNTPQNVKQFAPLLAGNPELASKVLPSLMRYSGGQQMADFDPSTGQFSFPLGGGQPPAPSTGTVPSPSMTAGVGGATSPGGPGPTPPPPPAARHMKVDLSTPGGRQMATLMDRQGRNKLNQQKADASTTFAEARKKLADLAVSKEVSRTMNPALASAGSALGKVAFTNIRSGRNIQTLSQGPVTWQQVSNALSDIAGAYHGGAPFAQEYMNQGFPNINQKFAQWNTYLTGQPQANVPEPIRKELLRMSQSLLDLDNAVLTQNAQTQGKLLKGVASPAQIQAGQGATADFITSSSGGGGQAAPNSGGWSYVGPAQ